MEKTSVSERRAPDSGALPQEDEAVLPAQLQDRVVMTETQETATAADVLTALVDALWKLYLDQVAAIPELTRLTLAHIQLLYGIQEQTPLTWRDARREFGKNSGMTARLIKDLVRRGLAEQCGDPFDRRIVYLRLSAAGTALLTRMEGYQRRCGRRLFGQISTREQSQVLHCLSTLLPPD